jgi:hypothetical protein
MVLLQSPISLRPAPRHRRFPRNICLNGAASPGCRLFGEAKVETLHNYSLTMLLPIAQLWLNQPLITPVPGLISLYQSN